MNGLSHGSKLPLRIAALGLALLASAGCARIKPDEVGIKTVNIGPGKGIVPRDYDPGYQWNLWPLHSWDRLPRTVQRLDFTKQTTGLPDPRKGPLLVKSAGGDSVQIDAVVFYRLKDGEAHKTLQRFRTVESYEAHVRERAANAGRAVFGRLQTEEFSDPEPRERVRLQAVELLRANLAEVGIELIDLLVEKIEFDAEYENLIKQKKLADERVNLERSKARAAEERGKVNKIRSETTGKTERIARDKELQMAQLDTETSLREQALRAEAERYATVKRAEADRYKAERQAEATLLRNAVEAEGARSMNEALSGPGGGNLVARQAARNLQLNEVSFPSYGYDWFNPKSMAERLGAEADVEPPAAAQPHPHQIAPAPEGAP